MKPRETKITPDIRARLQQVADLKRQIPSYKELERETGIKRTYLARVVHDMVHGFRNRNSVPRGAVTEEEFAKLMGVE